MEAYPKFIIEGEYLILGKCTYHKELAINSSEVKGGGWFDYKDHTFTLHGSSHDFGRADPANIKKAISEGKIEIKGSGRRDVTGFKFQYKNEVGEIYSLQ